MQWEGEARYAHGIHNSKDVLIGFKDGVNLDIQMEIVDSDRRFNEPSQAETLAKIDSHIRSLELVNNTVFLFRGDFNMYFDTKLDPDGDNLNLTVNSLTQFEIILKENDLCDISPKSLCEMLSWHQRTPFKQRRLRLHFCA